jgi:hypothetical protein
LLFESFRAHLARCAPIIHEAPANHFVGPAGVDGRLFLTTTELVFVSHRMAMQAHKTHVPLVSVSDALSGKLLRFASTGLTVWWTDRDGARVEERFAVQHSKHWERLVFHAALDARRPPGLGGWLELV